MEVDRESSDLSIEDRNSVQAKTKRKQITQFEKNVLLSTISPPEIINIVENKETNGVWTSKKEKTWNKVSNEFCSNVGVNSRIGEQLKKTWKNIKTRAK